MVKYAWNLRRPITRGREKARSRFFPSPTPICYIGREKADLDFSLPLPTTCFGCEIRAGDHVCEIVDIQYSATGFEGT